MAPTLLHLSLTTIRSMLETSTLLNPDCQRPQSLDHISTLVQSMEQNLLAGNFRFYSPLLMAIHMPTANHYILDGQHRLHAINQLSTKYPQFSATFENIPVWLDSYTTMAEIELAFDIINASKPYDGKLPPHQRNVIKDTIIAIQHAFPDALRSKTTRPPRISETQFTTDLRFILKRHPDMTSQQLVSVIIAANETIINSGIMTPAAISTSSTISGFALGVAKPSWVATIPDMKHLFERVKFKKHERVAVWNKIYGNSATGVCTGCNNVSIALNDFDVAHIIPRVSGGGNELANLYPLCRNCNNQMGTMTFDEYFRTTAI